MFGTSDLEPLSKRAVTLLFSVPLLALGSGAGAAQDRGFDYHHIGWPERLPAFVGLESDGWLPPLPDLPPQLLPRGDAAWFTPAPLGLIESSWALFTRQEQQSTTASMESPLPESTPQTSQVTSTPHAASAAPKSDANTSRRFLSRGRAVWYQVPGMTANGERYNPNELTAAHHSLPFGTKVLVVNEENGKSVVVRINDRGPAKRQTVINLSRAGAKSLDISGTARVSVYLAEDPPTPATTERVSQAPY